MSQLDEYKKTQEEHDLLCQLVAHTKSAVISGAVYNEGYNVHFRFVSTGGGNESRQSGRLATMLTKACAPKIEEIVAEAVKFSEADLIEKARAAQAEAIETLQTIRFEGRKYET